MKAAPAVPSMSPAVRLSLLTLSAFLLALPFGVPKPGLPQTLKADEPAYYMQAQSLAFDRDARCDVQDVRRLFAEFPYAPANNVVLMSDDGWRTVHYGKPFLYPLFAAPFTALWGANGMLGFNMLLFVAMIWMGTLHLRRFNADGLAALFAAVFFIASVAFSYVFWLQPEIFNMACVTAALFCGLEAAGERDTAGNRRWRRWGAVLSGAVLALAVFNKPMLLAFALPVWVYGWSAGGWRGLLSRALRWSVGFATVLALAAGGSLLLTGHANPYLGGERAGLQVSDPAQVPRVEPVVASAAPAAGGASVTAAKTAKPRRSWWWILRVPAVPMSEFLEDLRYFFLGRHTGLLLYLPCALLAVLYFALRGPRDAARWAVLAAVAGYALFVQLFIPFNWHGGGGFVGNRYFVNAYPALLFLVTAVAPRWLVPAVVGWAGLAIGTLLLTPFGRPMPFPTLQAHVRGGLFSRFPLELSLKELPGYWRAGRGGLAGWNASARRDLLLDRGDALWIHGATPVEIWLQGEEPMEDLVVAIRSAAPEDRVAIQLGEDSRELSFVSDRDPGEWQRVTLKPGEPDRVRWRGGNRIWVYRLILETRRGEVRRWTEEYPPPKSGVFAYNRTSQESFFTGADLLVLGSSRELATEVFAAQWERCELPARVEAASSFSVPVRIANRSQALWRSDGAAAVGVAFHWKSARFSRWDGERTRLAADVPPGETAELDVQVKAPELPGTYELEIDPVREHVGWFSQNGVAPCRAVVAVEPAVAASAAPTER